MPFGDTPNLTSLVAKLKRLTDKRDNRGKRHDLAFVLGGVILAIMSGRSYLSSIYRFIQNRLKWLRRVLGYQQAQAVSRAQLPRILDNIDWAALNELLEEHYGVWIEVQDKGWYALDGKTLRGVAGQQERVLLAVSHSERKTVAQQPMHGGAGDVSRYGVGKEQEYAGCLAFQSADHQANQPGGRVVCHPTQGQSTAPVGAIEPDGGHRHPLGPPPNH